MTDMTGMAEEPQEGTPARTSSPPRPDAPEPLARSLLRQILLGAAGGLGAGGADLLLAWWRRG
ncbi:MULTISPECIES: hypothetical protein [Streptomyces]|uniref:hypothetical protein n=1 Tax=Streptomyces TaxID=1883 RepID=UPI0013704627|nr:MULTISPECIES: hypothetical protein [Streptomyces]MYV89193.1 hypothetical protein [Streptomyces sp. SID1034]